MSIIYNSTTIQNLYCNNTEMTKAYSDKIKVFEKITDPLWYCFIYKTVRSDTIVYSNELSTGSTLKQAIASNKCYYANSSIDLNHIFIEGEVIYTTIGRATGRYIKCNSMSNTTLIIDVGISTIIFSRDRSYDLYS